MHYFKVIIWKIDGKIMKNKDQDLILIVNTIAYRCFLTVIRKMKTNILGIY